jgi:hypothetical protein
MGYIINSVRLVVSQILFLLLFLGNVVDSSAQNIKELDQLRVLYVGYSPEKPLPPNSLRIGAGISDDRFEEDLRSRMDAFKSLLNKYFGEVATIDARDYKEEISDDYDVTIFDGLPEPVRPQILERDPETGNTIRYEAAQYLSDGFSNAAVFIAQIAPTLGEPIGTKTDWYCMCLYNHAFEINTEHPVFNVPLKVQISMEYEKTPAELFMYPSGKNLPDKIPMWRVQTESSIDGMGYRTGVVAHGWPFMEAPDCEYISGGHSTKDITAAAIARHGNFLHWGFAASPEYMTNEASKAFVNAVYYMSQFNNRIPILRANNERLRPRSWVDYIIYSFSREKYEIDAENERRFVEMRLKEQIVAREKLKQGKELTTSEQYAVDFNAYEPDSWETYMEGKKNSQLVKSFDGNIEKVLAFLEENKPYYMGSNQIERESFDHDARFLGIPNNDHRILDAAISLLESGNDVDRAERILKRYTVKDFQDASEWRAWYNKVRDYLFFAEASGYKFFVDSYNNPTLYTEEIIGLENMSVPDPDQLNPVTSAAAILPTIDGNRAVVIKLSIMDGHYVYASASKNIPFVLFSAGIDLPDEIKPLGKMGYPQLKPYEGDPSISVYRGDIVLMQKITGESQGSISCTLNYQYCDDNHCSLPINKTIEIFHSDPE